MYALSFDMTIAELQKHYGKNYNRAYFEIKIYSKIMVLLY